jgi:PAS domain S-box-containing protein
MPLIPSRQTTQNLTMQAESLLQVLMQLHPAGNALLVVSPTGDMLAANAAAEALLRLSPGESIRGVAGLEADEDFAAFAAKLSHESLAKGQIDTQGGGSRTFQCQKLQFQNHTFLYLTVPAPEDLTPQAESTDDSYHNLFEDSAEPLFILDRAGNFIDINQSALELVQFEKQDIIGKSLFQKFELNLFERVALRNQLKSTLQGEAQRFEWWLREPDQELMPVEVSLRRGVFNNKTVIFGSAKNLY